MEEKLVSCPFCGGEPKWRRTKTRHCQLHGEPLQDYELGCFKIRCPLQPKVISNIKNECVKKWNTRN